VDVCRRWSAGAGPERRWIIQHALRSLVKRGDPSALAVLGYGSGPQIRVEKLALPSNPICLGDTLRFSLDLVSTVVEPQELIIDYQVHFVKANGRTGPKVFKLRQLVLPGAGSVRLDGRVSLAPMTTRQHYPGRHRIDLLVNGVEMPLAEFEVTA
jgi:hypothetical protein